MAVERILTSFRYTAASTSDIVLSGWGFQPKALIFHWCGRDSATDAVGAGDIRQGWGFATSTSDERCFTRTTINGGTSSAGSTYHRNDACVVIVDDGAVLNGYFSIKTIDSGGVTLQVDDAISIGLTVMVIGIGGDDITDAAGGTDTANASTGNKSNTSLSFQPDFIFFGAIIDGNTAMPGGSNSEDGIWFGVAKASGAGNQYVVAAGEDDGSATMDTGAYAFDNEFGASTNTSTPTTIVDRKQFVSMDASGFTWNQLELPQTAGSQFHFLAIKGGSWSLGDLLTQTDTSTTVSETTTTQPKLIIMASANRAKSTQDTGTTGAQLSFGAATSTSSRMVMAIQDQHGTANAECSTAIEYDAIYANISTSDAIQGLGDIPAVNSGSFDFIMDDADPSQAFAWWIAVGDSPAASRSSIIKEPYPYMQGAAMQRSNI